MGKRTKKIHDITLTKREMRLIKKGYKVFKSNYCIFLNIDRKTQRLIDKLKERIKELEQKRR